MQRISLFNDLHGPRRVLALGAHADDIEIGCGGTLLRMAAEVRELEVLWVVLSSTPERAREAEASAAAFLGTVAHKRVVILDHRDGFMPYNAVPVKEDFERLKTDFAPDLIFTHYRDDRHQDHRLVSDLTWNTWRNHMVLEYEVPKYDGDLGTPNFFARLNGATVERKIALILEHFPSQLSKKWFNADILRALPRIRGMECGAGDGFAEAFYCRKASF